MFSLARIIIILGVVLLVTGGIVYAFEYFSKVDFPFGKLPGDIRIERDNFSCIFPLASSILLSIILTLILNLVVRFFNR